MRRLGGPLIVVLLAVWPWLVHSPYFLQVAVVAGIYAILSLGLNVMIGHAGLFMLGYAGIYAIGAYSTAILMVHHHWSFWATLPVAVAASALGGLLVGLPTLRLGPIYLAIVTLGLGEIIQIAATNLGGLTGGPNGIGPVLRPSVFGFVLRTPLHFYYLVWIFVGLCYLAARLWDRSQVGRAWCYLRDDEQAAEVAGIDVVRLKLLAMVVGSALAGIAGPLFAADLTHVTPDNFSFVESVLVVTMIVVGGIGNPSGAVLGAVVMTVLPELFRGLADYRLLLQGVILALFLLFRSDGLLREVRPDYAETEALPAPPQLAGSEAAP